MSGHVAIRHSCRPSKLTTFTRGVSGVGDLHCDVDLVVVVGVDVDLDSDGDVNLVDEYRRRGIITASWTLSIEPTGVLSVHPADHAERSYERNGWLSAHPACRGLLDANQHRAGGAATSLYVAVAVTFDVQVHA